MKRRKPPYWLVLLLLSFLLSGFGTGLAAQGLTGVVKGPMRFLGEEDMLICMEAREDAPGTFHAVLSWPESRPEYPVLISLPELSVAGELRVNGIHMGGDSLSMEGASYNIGPFIKKGSNSLELIAHSDNPVIRIRLARRNKLFLESWTPEIHQSGDAGFLLRINLSISSYHHRPGNKFESGFRLIDPDGSILAEKGTASGIAPAFGQLRALVVDFPLDSLSYWQPDKPRIYQAEFFLDESTTGQKQEVMLPFYLCNFALEDSLLISGEDSLILRFPPQNIEACHMIVDSLLLQLKRWNVNALRSPDPLPMDLRFILGEQGILSLPSEN